MNKYSFDFNKIISFIIMIVISYILITALTSFVDRRSQDDTSAIVDSINSALMQTYALEGAYPSDMYHLKEYGIWFNEDKYYYDYGYIDGGIMPMVNVVSKSNRNALDIEGEEGQDIFLQ